MKKYIKIIGIIAFLVSLILITILYKRNRALQEKYSTSIENLRAYSLEANGQNRVFKLTIDQLSYLNDSLTTKLDSVRKSLAIKDKDIKQMQYLLTLTSKRDTIIFSDTIFKSDKVNIDTLLKDKWYSLQLKLKYPNIIEVSPSFKNESYIYISSKKETINPPKKFFLFRWFQKKHIISEITVLSESPYSSIKQQRFIEIIK